jgi:histidine kinase
MAVTRSVMRLMSGEDTRTSLASETSSSTKTRAQRSSITSVSPQPRKANDLSALTINKLKYASLGFYGRETELALLNATLAKLMSSESPEQARQLILISGYSGTGKTALVRHALKKSAEKLGGLFVRGKFDLHLRNEPYSGIAAACTEICEAILQLRIGKRSVFEPLCSRITTELGSELALLIQVVPNLAKVLENTGANEPSFPNDPAQNVALSAAGSKNKFNFAFLRFIRAVSLHFVPLVFVLDDLQWADGASLDLLDVLVTDPKTSKLMVVGIYRSNEVDSTHVFYRIIEELTMKCKDKYFEMTQLQIGNLPFDSVHTIVQQLLDMDNNSSRTWGLADICYSKTHGNVFFLLRFISMLKERQMIEFNFGTFSWTWDDQEILSRTSPSDNVVDLLKSNMEELSKDAIDILKLAACLGSNFDVHTLSIVWERSCERTPDADDALSDTLARLEADGFIAQSTSKSTHYQFYSWTHDKIQEAATTLVPEAERGAFAAKIGGILLSHLDEEDLDYAIFVVVNLLNRADDKKKMQNDKARLDLARLNYSASRKAISCSAFESAAAYAARGIQLLPANAWEDHYRFTLGLFTIGAQAEGFMGNIEMMELYYNHVLLQKDKPIQDKLEVYHTWIDSVMNRGKLVEARDVMIDILKKNFRCEFPKNPAAIALGIAGSILKIKATMKSRDVSKLRQMKDTTRIECMKLVDKLSVDFYLSNDSRMPLCVFRMMNWTMKYGYCEYSPVNFALTGMILAGILNDLQGGSKYGEQALMLLERTKAQSAAPRTKFCVYALVFCWTMPVRSLLKPLLHCYDIGLQAG